MTCERCYREVTDPADHGVSLCPFERRVDVIATPGFEARFDIGLGRDVSGWGDIHKAMREMNLDFRDHPSPGQRSVRLDKVHEAKRNKERRARG